MIFIFYHTGKVELLKFFGGFTTSWNDYAAINGLNAFKFDIDAFKIILNVSVTLIVL